jgi:hypothetical protein
MRSAKVVELIKSDAKRMNPDLVFPTSPTVGVKAYASVKTTEKAGHDDRVEAMLHGCGYDGIISLCCCACPSWAILASQHPVELTPRVSSPSHEVCRTTGGDTGNQGVSWLGDLDSNQD